jgi:hypothetical protein
MGIEASENKGILSDDLMSLIKGHITKGYKASTSPFKS